MRLCFLSLFLCRLPSSLFLVIEKCPTNDGTGEEFGSWGTLLLLWTLSEGHLAPKHSMAPKEFGFCYGEQNHLWVEHSDVLSFYSEFSDCHRKQKAFLQLLVWVNFYFSVVGKQFPKFVKRGQPGTWSLKWVNTGLNRIWQLSREVNEFYKQPFLFSDMCRVIYFFADTFNISTQ